MIFEEICPYSGGEFRLFIFVYLFIDGSFVQGLALLINGSKANIGALIGLEIQPTLLPFEEKHEM